MPPKGERKKNALKYAKECLARYEDSTNCELSRWARARAVLVEGVQEVLYAQEAAVAKREAAAARLLEHANSAWRDVAEYADVGGRHSLCGEHRAADV
mgnify:CR=1 FL=1